jgi:hypothetical protein
MKRKFIWQYCKTGFKEAQEMHLENINNWTPLLVYIHVSRIIIGAFLGCCIGILTGLLI